MRNTKNQRKYEVPSYSLYESPLYPGIWCASEDPYTFWANDGVGYYKLTQYFNKATEKWKVKQGYWRVHYNKKIYYAHIIIASIFVPGYKPGYVVDHIDGNSMNNDPKNLQWITRSENLKKYWNVDISPDERKKHVDKFVAGIKSGHAAGHYDAHIQALANARRKK